MESQTTFINRDIRPGLLEQIILADGLSGTVHENNKDIQRTGAQMYRNSAFSRSRSAARNTNGPNQNVSSAWTFSS
jgi:hypothetical protein